MASPWTPQEVEDYLSQNRVQDLLSEAVNDAVQHKATEPVAHIADFLAKLATADPLAVTEAPTAPIVGQQPGTSGLRNQIDSGPPFTRSISDTPARRSPANCCRAIARDSWPKNIYKYQSARQPARVPIH
jgi:hypothetical protein